MSPSATRCEAKRNWARGSRLGPRGMAPGDEDLLGDPVLQLLFGPRSAALFRMAGFDELAAAQADRLGGAGLRTHGILAAIGIDFGNGLGDARRAVRVELHGVHAHDELAHVEAAALEQELAAAVAVDVDRAHQP